MFENNVAKIALAKPKKWHKLSTSFGNIDVETVIEDDYIETVRTGSRTPS